MCCVYTLGIRYWAGGPCVFDGPRAFQGSVVPPRGELIPGPTPLLLQGLAPFGSDSMGEIAILSLNK